MWTEATLLGFACDEGVRRNGGRVGAVAGPEAIRAALARLASLPIGVLREAGDVSCVSGDLEAAQAELAERVGELLQRGENPLLLGGGHELAWGSYQGIRQHIGDASLGIINFDAHFDLRDPAAGGNSGTPFRQVAEACEDSGTGFHYLVLGVNPAMNAKALFDYASAKQVQWYEDSYCSAAHCAELGAALEAFIAARQFIYLSICLDAFPAALTPGVSAPGVPGMCPFTAIELLHWIQGACQRQHTALILVDLAEMNPHFDRDGITARWAARLVHELLCSD
ncbi:MAG: formiminoglutamase [Halieaceae bacterium]|jgi:formiminoglutamase